MGNKILVSVFDSERTAFEGLTALKDLHWDGDITLYASTVIAKDAAGKVSVRQTADDGPIGTLAGIVTGGLVGLLGGPAGVAVGAYVGGFGGLMYDLFKAGVSLDFVDEVSASLTPGTAAVVADIDEMWVTPVDTRLGALGGTTFRRFPGEVIDTELIRETDAARAELEQLRAEVKETTGEAKAKVEASIEAQRRKLEALVERVDKALAQEKAEFEARLATLREQQAKARESQRQKIDARMADLKASHEIRKAKLEEARRLAKASAETTREALMV
ncbi:MAG TPA: DUF1269 domain-containing protein [Candidatus Limnocylindrales bacterium]|jgi:uncharacterized membrane protein|nr:DUF1269 domain-containing protein [Candidatus Limnocylindrales bacterium]